MWHCEYITIHNITFTFVGFISSLPINFNGAIQESFNVPSGAVSVDVMFGPSIPVGDTTYSRAVVISAFQ